MSLKAFVRGAIFGGIIVYLTAPRSGYKTRKMLAQKGSELKDMFQESIDEISGMVKPQQSALRLEQPDIIITETIYTPESFRDM